MAAVEVQDQLGKMAIHVNANMNPMIFLTLVMSVSKYDIKLMVKRLRAQEEWVLPPPQFKDLLHRPAVTIHSRLGKMYFTPSLVKDVLPA